MDDLVTVQEAEELLGITDRRELERVLQATVTDYKRWYPPVVTGDGMVRSWMVRRALTVPVRELTDRDRKSRQSSPQVRAVFGQGL